MSSTVETAMEIRPFHVDIPEEKVTDLRRCIAATNWPEKETVADASQGVPLATMQELARYWGTGYDWRVTSSLAHASLNLHVQDYRSRGSEFLAVYTRSRSGPADRSHGDCGRADGSLRRAGRRCDLFAGR
jgi:hypothetical protein